VKEKYECISCSSVITLDENTLKESIKCCPKPDLKLLSAETSEEELQIQLGDCYEKIIDCLRYYIEMPEDKYKFLAIWIIGTYFHKEFNTYPLLYFNAMKGSAKTRTSKLVNYLSCGGKGMVTNNTTEAVLFRHPKHIIMSLDEIERIGNKEMSSIRELLNAVYKKGTKIERSRKVKTKDGEDFVVEHFEPFFPLTIANIYGIEEVLQDRAFTIILEKSNNPLYTAIIEDWEDRPEITSLKFALSKKSEVSVVKLRRKNYIHHWNDFIKGTITTLTTYNTIYNNTTLTTPNREEREEMLEKDDLFKRLYSSGIIGRNLELSFPLLITARLISIECFEDLLKTLNEMVGVKKEEEYFENMDISLYDFVVNYNKGAFEYVTIKQMIRDFREFIDHQEEWLNGRWLGKALVRLNLTLEKKKTNCGIKVILNTPKAKEKLKMFHGECVNG